MFVGFNSYPDAILPLTNRFQSLTLREPNKREPNEIERVLRGYFANVVSTLILEYAEDTTIDGIPLSQWKPTLSPINTPSTEHSLHTATCPLSGKRIRDLALDHVTSKPRRHYFVLQLGTAFCDASAALMHLSKSYTDPLTTARLTNIRMYGTVGSPTLNYVCTKPISTRAYTQPNNSNSRLSTLITAVAANSLDLSFFETTPPNKRVAYAQKARQLLLAPPKSPEIKPLGDDLILHYIALFLQDDPTDRAIIRRFLEFIKSNLGYYWHLETQMASFPHVRDTLEQVVKNMNLSDSELYDSQFLQEYGQMVMALGYMERADDILTRALELDNSSMLTSCLLAHIAINKTDYLRATMFLKIGYFRSGHSSNSYACYLRATLDERENNPVSAERAYKAAIGKDPKNCMAHLALGRLLVNQKRNKEAIDYYEYALHHNPKNKELITALEHLKGGNT